jgi:iron(III) transport system permease protein
MTRALANFLTVVLTLILLAFLVWPILLTVSGGFVDPSGAFTLRYIASVFQDPLWMQGLFNSLKIATGTTLLCLIITMPLALLATRYEFAGKGVITSLILVPLILPPFVGAIGLRALLGRFGALNSLLATLGIIDANGPGIDFLGGGFIGGRYLGVVLMEALALYPILYLNISAALANLDPALDEAAIGLGASRLRRFFGITFPLILPGVFAGCTIVFIWSFTELGTPLMFDYYTVTPVQVYWGIQEVATNPRPYALVVVMLSTAVLLYLAGRLTFGGKAYAMQSKASVAATSIRLRGWRSAAVAGLFIAVAFMALLPHIGVIFSSFTVDGTWYRSLLPQQWTVHHYEQALTHPLSMGSIRNSLFLATLAMLLAVALGLTLSYLTVRVKVRGSWMLDSLAMLPLAVPGLVMAFGYVAMSLTWPFNGTLPESLRFLPDWIYQAPLAGMFDILGRSPNPVPLLIIAYAVRRLPYVVRSASAGLQQTSGQLEEAALNLGAPLLYAMRRIVFPLILANIIAGAILAFSFAMLEVSDSLILAQREEHYPITKAIYELFNRLGDGPYIASAMGVWGMALLTITLVGASVMMGKKLGAIFRV